MKYEYLILEDTIDNVSANTYADTEDLITLAHDECGEIQRIEIIQPSTSGALRAELVINDQEYKHIRSNITPDFNTLPPYKSDSYNVAQDFGIPLGLIPKVRRVPTAVEFLTPKVGPDQHFNVRIYAGADGIDSTASPPTGPVRVRVHFWKYKGDDTLRTLTGTATYDASFALVDLERGILDRFTKSVPLSVDTFDELPGGLRQARPYVFLETTYATNKLATTPNKPYIFRKEEGTVDETWQNLWWNYDEKEARIPLKIAVKPHANLKEVRFNFNAEDRLILPADPEGNILILGNETSYQPTFEPPRVFTIYKVKAYYAIVDNGTSIPANGVKIAFESIYFNLRR